MQWVIGRVKSYEQGGGSAAAPGCASDAAFQHCMRLFSQMTEPQVLRVFAHCTRSR